MSIARYTVLLSVGAVILARPMIAQGGASSRATRIPAVPPKAAADTTKKVPSGVVLDFQDQELRVVLDALVAAGDLNASMSNIPSQHITLHMGRPVTRDGMVELVKSVAEQNGLKVTQTASLIQIAGPDVPRTTQTPAQTFAQQLMQANQPQPTRLFTYRLKHASAVQLAPVLTNLFSGTSNSTRFGGTTVIPNANGGFSTINTGPFTISSPPPGNAAAGITGNTTNIATPFGGRGGRGNAGGGGGGGGGGGVGAGALAQLSTAFQQVSGALSGQASDIRIIPEESTNSLLVRASDTDWPLVQQVIQNVDLRPLQVLIEVTIAEVERTHALDLGVSGSAKRIPKGKTAADATATAPSPASARDFILELTGGKGTINYDVAISALQERGNVRVLSLPVIIAQNNRQATLNVGSQRPFVQVSQTVANDPTGRVQTVQYVNVGTVLTITPTINPDGYVNLQVSQTDNSATNEVQFDAPVINTREATTQIFIRDGQTTVIGGLAGNTHSTDISGIPLLSRIPIIGPLIFGSTTHNEDTSELFLFLTPHIISSDEDIDKLREAVKDGSDLLKEIDVGPRIVPARDSLRIKPDTARTDSLTTMRRRPPR